VNDDDKHLKFIDELSSSLAPVNVHWSAERRGVFWLVSHVIWISILMYMIQPFRGSILDDLEKGRFIAEVALFFSALIMAGYFAFLSLVPGGIKTRRIKFLLIPITILIGTLIYGEFHFHKPIARQGLRSFCEFEIMLYSMGPLCHFFYLAKKGVFHHGKWPLFCGGFASALIPALIMHFACAYDYKHILLFHLGPIFLMTLLAAPIFLKLKNKL